MGASHPHRRRRVAPARLGWLRASDGCAAHRDPLCFLLLAMLAGISSRLAPAATVFLKTADQARDSGKEFLSHVTAAAAPPQVLKPEKRYSYQQIPKQRSGMAAAAHSCSSLPSRSCYGSDQLCSCSLSPLSFSDLPALSSDCAAASGGGTLPMTRQQMSSQHRHGTKTCALHSRSRTALPDPGSKLLCNAPTVSGVHTQMKHDSSGGKRLYTLVEDAGLATRRAQRAATAGPPPEQNAQ